MGLLARAIFREVATSAVLGTVLFTFVLFLQRVGKLFEILVRSSASPQTVASLFALAIPFTLTFTVPLGVLVGVLIALSRMSSDGEITAMRAAGIPARKVIPPVLVLATVAMMVAATASLWLTPFATWRTYKILNQLVAAELTSEVQPRVFEEQFPNRIVYVGDVIPGAVTRWRNVFIADMTPPEERKNEAHDRGDNPRVTVASDAIAVADVAHNLIQLSMLNVATHEVDKDSAYHRTTSPKGDQILEATKPNEIVVKAFTEMDTVPLYRIAYQDPKTEPDKRLEARIEFNQRLALPPACFLLALIGIPLGVSSKKGGRAGAFVMTVALAFLYWVGLLFSNGLAKQQKLPVGVAMWIPNTVFAVIGLAMLVRLDRPGHMDVIGTLRGWFADAWQLIQRVAPSPANPARAARPKSRFPLVPQVMDTYILTTFLFYFATMLVSFVLMTHVYTFFELLSDIVKNHIAMFRVLTYLFFLTPHLIYDSTPISVLVSVLVTFGILTKHNEITAFKACGVSLYRLAVPILVASILLSGGLFAFDHYYVPQANRKQDAIRSEIKGKPVQTYLHPERQWIYSAQGSRVYYYKFFDPATKVMGGVNVYELDPANFHLVKHISAEKARWERQLQKWIFENGWSRDFDAKGGERFQNFAGQVMTFPELDEHPEWFLKEQLQDKQMNYLQLAAYIRDLQQSGFDTIALQVQFYRKFAVPLFAAIMALIATPFAFVAGNRGASAGVGVSFGIAIAYWAISLVSAELGDVNLLPAAMAAWSPDVLFAMAGFYFFTRMRT
jgi:LPS export ABC transporter permease LptG/LPS export ABC transporter permease LptF